MQAFCKIREALLIRKPVLNQEALRAFRMYLDGITSFIFQEDQPEKADIIFVPGGNYPEAAERAAQLYLEGYAPLICPSGKYSRLKGHFELPLRSERRAEETEGAPDCQTEWEFLSTILLRKGVPGEAILEESQATFTWENAIFSRKVCESRHIKVQKAILCCQNWHARRCLMYYGQQFPETQFFVCPVSTRGITRDNWYLDPERADVVLSEVERCGAQFHEIVRHYQEGKAYCRPDDWKSPFGRG